MADSTTHELAELTARVLPDLPCAVNCVWDVGADCSSRGVLVRLEGDRYVLRCSVGCPAPGGRVSVHAAVEGFVYTLLGAVTGVAGRGEVFVTLDSVRRKRQGRAAPRTFLGELCLLSEMADAKARLLDVGPDGFGFLHDDPVEIGAEVQTVVTVQGVEIPSFAVVRNVKRYDDGRFRVGCWFVAVSDQHREVIRSAATPSPSGRRIRGLGYQGGLGRWWALTG
jgi:hypothetical protein